MSKLIETTTGRRLALAILGVIFVISASALIAYNALTPTAGVTVVAGQVAPADIIAPRSITYDSDVLTQLARQAAADSIHDVFDPPNPNVARQQLQLARHVLDYIDNVRHDTFATPSQQISDLDAITVLKLDTDTATSIVRLPDDTWKDIDGQVM